MICSCKRFTAPTATNYFGSSVEPGYSYSVNFNCDACHSSRTAALWLSEEAMTDIAAATAEQERELAAE